MRSKEIISKNDSLVHNKKIILLLISTYTLLFFGTFIGTLHAQTNTAEKTLRVGYFPNINHAQAVIGFNNGEFQKTLGNNTKVETILFNAGPSAIEALLAKRIDAAYIGPSPSINGYVVSGGKDVR